MSNPRPTLSAMLEICIDGADAAQAAADGGADRVELCANLPEGGTTPSAGTLRVVRRMFPGPVMVIIRPRGYDFLYSKAEFEVMCEDIAVAREAGADGIVSGCLNADGTIDADRTGRLMEAAAGMDFTFHRAFDMCQELATELEKLIELGVRRVLTSGGRADVMTGSEVIRELAKQAAGRISIMPGGGVTLDNLAELVSGCGVDEIHMSGRSAVDSRMTFRKSGCGMGTFSEPNEYRWKSADAELIRQAGETLRGAIAKRG